MRYYVVIVEDANGEIVSKMGPESSLRNAERIESGVDRNLNHNEFSALVLNEDELRGFVSGADERRE